jgi:hypothetical protein
MTFVINFISGPSVGKSLMSALVYAELKTCGYTTEYVQEYAKTLVWLKDFEKLNNQYYVSKKQYEMINALYSVKDIDYIVVDSSLWLCMYYNRVNKNNVSNVEKTDDMIKEKMKEFKNIYIVLERNLDIKYENYGRIQTQSESLVVDAELLLMIKELGLEYKSFKSKRESVKDIIEYICTLVKKG